MKLRQLVGLHKFRIGESMSESCSAFCDDCYHQRDEVDEILADGGTYEEAYESMGSWWINEVENAHSREMDMISDVRSI